jgi:hypothetical protein
MAVGYKASETCTKTAAQKCGDACAASFVDIDSSGASGGTPMSSDGTGSVGSHPSDDPCAACENDIMACTAVGDKACANDPNCAAATRCLNDAKCDDKDSDGEAGASDIAYSSDSSSSSSGGN